MPLFRWKPVEAHRWFKNGDHPLDNPFRPFEDTGKVPDHPREGQLVRYYRHPSIGDSKKCEKCEQIMHIHGWLDDANLPVCPGDWIVTHHSSYIVWDNETFQKAFEPVTT